MNIFDIIGPVMVGPSSSHTAGVVRIGQAVRGILGEEPAQMHVSFHGSFSTTYQGHGSDKAIVAGMLGLDTGNLHIRDSFELASKNSLQFSFDTAHLQVEHPNSLQVAVIGKTGRNAVVIGSSLGGGRIEIVMIDGMPVQYTGEYETLLITHQDRPGVIAYVSMQLAAHNVNVAQMRTYRDARGALAMMIIESDEPITSVVLAGIETMQHVKHVRLIRRIEV